MIILKSPADVSEDWFAAYTFSCQEKRVAGHLSSRQIEFFLPVHKTISRWKNGVTMQIERPLFPGYVFVRIHCKNKVRVLELPGVHSIVGTGRQPIPLPYEQIEALRRGISGLHAEPHPFLKSGDKVIIRGGPLEGLTGIVVRQRNGARVVLSLDLIMKSISVEVETKYLESFDEPPRVSGYFPSLASVREAVPKAAV